MEDNSSNFVEVNMGEKCHYKVARSVFKSVIGVIRIYESDEHEKEIWKRCVDVKNCFNKKDMLKMYSFSVTL